jgi:hypothetical protein
MPSQSHAHSEVQFYQRRSGKLPMLPDGSWSHRLYTDHHPVHGSGDSGYCDYVLRAARAAHTADRGQCGRLGRLPSKPVGGVLPEVAGDSYGRVSGAVRRRICNATHDQYALVGAVVSIDGRPGRSEGCLCRVSAGNSGTTPPEVAASAAVGRPLRL